MSHITTERYKTEARKAIKDRVLQSALASVQDRLGKGTAKAYRELPEGPGLRRAAHDMRMQAVENLDILLETLAENIGKNGGRVIFADDARAAVTACIDIARKHEVKQVVKGKSMVTEEIGLNPALQAAGIEVTETDLGEYIIQLAGESPSHIIAPAIHKTREQVGRLFAKKLGISYTDDPPILTRTARKALRQKFLTADMGISGCNLACAETGHITTVSNEGNIRMATTLPRVHVAFMGMERVTARLEDHDILFRLLSRGAAAQHLAGYISYIGGPRQTGQMDGPEAFYLIIIDNGRSKILADTEFREILCCIRCAACLNVCPVYGKIGGHAYGSAYSGPVGAVVTPLLAGIERAKDLFLGETLCGACKDACPVDIDLPRMLLALRARLVRGGADRSTGGGITVEKVFYRAWSAAIYNRRVYAGLMRTASMAQRPITGAGGMIHHLPFPFDGWTRSRDLKPLTSKSFMERWNDSRLVNDDDPK
jgi:L-lactate dehydrogenase complex protein LldF